MSAGQPRERGLEVADHLVDNRYIRVRIHGIHVDRQQGDLADPGLVLDLDDVIAEPHHEISRAQELALHLTASPFDAAQ